MGWNSKSEVIAFLVILGIPLIFVLCGVISPILFNIQYGGVNGIVTVIVLLVLICGGIYAFKRIKKRNKNSK